MVALAEQLGREAISFTRSGSRSGGMRRKADTSVVTAVDEAIQEFIVATISSTYPDHGIIAEEDYAAALKAPTPGAARYCWVVDPLDGTRNFVTGYPCFATSIAVLERGLPVVAAVVEHNLEWTWTALLGGGAWCNGNRLGPIREPSECEDILVGIPSTKDHLTVQVAGSWIAESGLVCRNVGSTAVHLALVASGALAGAFCKRCKIWDLAAGVLLVQEVGGKVSDPYGAPRVPFDLGLEGKVDLPYLVGTPLVHERLQRLIGGLPNN